MSDETRVVIGSSMNASWSWTSDEENPRRTDKKVWQPAQVALDLAKQSPIRPRMVRREGHREGIATESIRSLRREGIRPVGFRLDGYQGSTVIQRHLEKGN